MSSRSTDDAAGAKRARVDNGADSNAQSYVASSSAAAAPSTPAAPSINAQIVPQSSILTHNAPSWAAELPAFLDAIAHHEPTIPDEVVHYLLERSGCNVNDPKLVRLVSLAAQHFLFDVMHDARQYQKLRTKDKANTELTLADLSSSLQNHGVKCSAAEYYADHTTASGDFVRQK